MRALFLEKVHLKIEHEASTGHIYRKNPEMMSHTAPKKSPGQKS